MKCKKLFSFFAASTVALTSVTALTNSVQAQWGGWGGGYIPNVSNYIPDVSNYIPDVPYIPPVRDQVENPLGLVERFVPGGVARQVLTYTSRGIDIATGRTSVVEGVLDIVGASVGGVAGGILSDIRTGVGVYREAVSYNGYLQYGEQDPRQWTIRNDQGKDEVVDSQAWELTFANGEPKFVLVLKNGTKKEYPIDNLYNEKDLRYLCKHILGKLKGAENLTTVADNSEKPGSGLSQNLKKVTERLNNINDPVQLRIFFKYLTDELSSVSLGVVEIVAGTQAGEERVLTIRGEKWTFRWCPAGEFVMGSPVTERLRQMNEREHRVILTQGFWILDSQVTCQMYSRVTEMSVDGKTVSNPQRPMTGVDWNTSQGFCEELSMITNHTVTLPTEAQWEYACRAGSQNENIDDTAISEVAWFKNNSLTTGTSGSAVGSMHDVREKKANAWGIYDMRGNVWEWCSDWYGYYSDSDATDPTGPANGRSRIMRGGSYDSPAMSCRSAYRNWQDPTQKDEHIGFRVVLIPDSPKETKKDNASAEISEIVPTSTVDATNDNIHDEEASTELEDDVIVSTTYTENTEEVENVAGFNEEVDDEKLPAVPENISAGNTEDTVAEDTDQVDAQNENTKAETVQSENGGKGKTKQDAEFDKNAVPKAPSFGNLKDQKEILDLVGGNKKLVGKN